MIKFIVVSKKKLLNLLFFILLIICLFFITYSFFNKWKSTFSSLSLNIHNDLENDFDGDGSVDSLTLNKYNSHYVVKIKTAKNLYTLKSINYGESLIDISDSLQPKVKALDLSRDGIPEIILSGCKDNKPITYIFKWKDDNFTEVFSTSYNIFGVLDSKNSKTPKILYALSEKGDESTKSLIFNGNEIKDISFSKTLIPSLGVVQKFIDLIQLDYELTETPGLFTPYIESSELGILWTLSKDTFRYSFQTGYFYDIN
ncbi:MAG: hypothetical protein PUD59_06825, partial [bacterium]|nr:hypothetical protein [bacterium]